MKRLFVAAMGTVVAVGAQAGSFKLDNGDVAINGGVAGGVYMGTNVGQKDNANVQLSDVIVGMKTPTVGKGIGVSFEGAIGSILATTVYDAGVNLAAPSFGVPYGWMSVNLTKDLKIDMGRLATNIGSEATPSLSNDHILRGMVWNAQPTYYPGARATFSMGDLNLYAEFAEKINGVTPYDDAIAVGVLGSAGKNISFGASYMGAKEGISYVDVLGKMNMGGMELGANADYIMADKSVSVTGKSASAFGAAVYAKVDAGAVTVPVRVEFVSDSDKTVYGSTNGAVKSGFSLTVTPTMKAGDNGFVRAELAFVNSNEKIFADKDGAAQNTQISLIAQAGYRF